MEAGICGSCVTLIGNRGQTTSTYLAVKRPRKYLASCSASSVKIIHLDDWP
jgi:hypothetical protein